MRSIPWRLLLLSVMLLLAPCVKAMHFFWLSASPGRSSWASYHNEVRGIPNIEALMQLKIGDRLALRLPRGWAIMLVERQLYNYDGSTTLSGKIDGLGQYSRAYLSFSKDIITGNIYAFGRSYIIHGNAKKAFLKEPRARRVSTSSTHDVVMVSSTVEDSVPVSSLFSSNKRNLPATIDVMVLYPQTFIDKYGEGYQARISHLINMVNQNYRDNDTQIHLRLVYTLRTQLDAEHNISEALLLALSQSKLSDAERIAQMREHVGADIVVLLKPLAANDNDCGWSYLADSPELLSVEHGFAVVAEGEYGQNYCDDNIFVREIGRLLGQINAHEQIIRSRDPIHYHNCSIEDVALLVANYLPTKQSQTSLSESISHSHLKYAPSSYRTRTPQKEYKPIQSHRQALTINGDITNHSQSDRFIEK